MFGGVGGIGVVWKLIFLYILVSHFHTSPYLAVLPIFVLINIHNYILNNSITFKNKKQLSFHNYLEYLGVNLISIGIYFSVYYGLLSINIHYLIASTIAVGFAGIINYVASIKIIWGEKRWQS